MINTDYNSLFTYEKLFRGHRRGRLAKRDKKPLVRFEMSVLENVYTVYRELISGNFKIKGYNSFVVYEPKFRRIQTLYYRHRVVQHVLCDEVLMPYFSKRAILDNAVCQKGKGTHFALQRFEDNVRSFVRKHGSGGYVLKCDILKYFPTIPHDRLKAIFCAHIKDKRLRDLVCLVIDSYHTDQGYLDHYGVPARPEYTKENKPAPPHQPPAQPQNGQNSAQAQNAPPHQNKPAQTVAAARNYHTDEINPAQAQNSRPAPPHQSPAQPQNSQTPAQPQNGRPAQREEIKSGRGIPIGNQTSQVFGMFFLDKVDRLVKEKFGVKVYSRYMDDFVIVHESKEFLRMLLKEITAVTDYLGLKLNSKTQIFPLKNGFTYLGFRYFVTPTGKLVKTVKKKTKRRLRWRTALLTKARKENLIPAERVRQSLAAFHGHLKHSNSYKLERELFKKLCALAEINPKEICK